MSWQSPVLFYKVFLAIKSYEAPLPSKWLGQELFKYPQAFIFFLSLFKMWDEKLSLCSNCKNKVIPKLKISCYIPFLFTWLGLGTQTCYLRLLVILRSKLNKTVINTGWVRLSPKHIRPNSSPLLHIGQIKSLKRFSTLKQKVEEKKQANGHRL